MLSACFDTKKSSLPILGNRDVVNGDTVYPTIRDFAFLNQDSQVLNNATFAGKAYVVDFFFVSCPTICPKTTKQMLRLYEKYQQDDRLMLVAHTVDPKHDTIPRLKKHAEKLGVKGPKWSFLTATEGEIYGIAADYFSVAKKDETAPGGFDHSGRLILVDKNRHVRAFCDGTDPKDVDRFMEDIDLLLKTEY
jgi:protein SCO1/2